MGRKKTREKALTHYLQGKKMYEVTKYTDAFSELKEAYNFFKHTNEYSIVADILRLMGEILFNKGNYIESRNHYKRAYQAFKDFGHKIGMADCYDQIALSFMFQNELTYAEEYQEKALKLRRSVADKKGLARGLKNLAIILYKQDENTQKAAILLEEALELASKSKDPQLVVNIALDKGKIENKLGFYSEAMKSYVIARRFSKKYSFNLSDDFEEEFADVLLNLGLQKYDQGNLTEALKYLKKSLLIYKTKGNSIVKTIEGTILKIEKLLA